MHTYNGKSCIFVHNSDLSGGVKITDTHGNTIEVAGADLINFLGNWVRQEAISRLENMNGRDVLLSFAHPK